MVENIEHYNKQLREGWDIYNDSEMFFTEPNKHHQQRVVGGIQHTPPDSEEEWDPRDDHRVMDYERELRDQIPENDVRDPEKIVEDDLRDYDYIRNITTKRYGFDTQSRIHIFEWDSRERNRDLWPKHYEYRIDFDRPYENVVSVELLQASISKTEFNINAQNQWIDWIERNDTGEYSNILSTFLPVGDYPNKQDLVEAISTAMNRPQDISVTVIPGSTLLGNSFFDCYIEDVDYYLKRQDRVVIEMAKPGTSTTKFELLWDSGPHRTQNLSETIGFLRQDTGNSPSSVSVGGGISISQKAPNLLNRESGQVFTISDVNRRIIYNLPSVLPDRINSFITTEQVTSKRSFTSTKSGLSATINNRAHITAPNRLWTTRPPYVDIHTRELDSIQNGLLSRIPLLAQETQYEKSFPVRRFFHPIKTLGSLTLSFNRFGYKEELRKGNNQDSSRDVIGRKSVIPYEFNGVPHALTLEIITIERFHPNNFIIE